MQTWRTCWVTRRTSTDAWKPGKGGKHCLARSTRVVPTQAWGFLEYFGLQSLLMKGNQPLKVWWPFDVIHCQEQSNT